MTPTSALPRWEAVWTKHSGVRRRVVIVAPSRNRALRLARISGAKTLGAGGWVFRGLTLLDAVS